MGPGKPGRAELGLQVDNLYRQFVTSVRRRSKKKTKEREADEPADDDRSIRYLRSRKKETSPRRSKKKEGKNLLESARPKVKKALQVRRVSKSSGKGSFRVWWRSKRQRTGRRNPRNFVEVAVKHKQRR
ncbi:hypothetical protein EJ110_NYTH17385 [Nymphaea thermarum]|nr:hypothetical protein EJ110_NYTH17385 [Nymphaea thermarum]